MESIPEYLKRSHRYFCYACGKMLPDQQHVKIVTCTLCKTQTYLNWFSNTTFEYSIGLDADSAPTNASDTAGYVIDDNYRRLVKSAKHLLVSESIEREAGTLNEEESVPSISRECNNCGHQRMSYATMQTRSADEGQTVFYTCLNCHKKEIEYS